MKNPHRPSPFLLDAVTYVQRGICPQAIPMPKGRFTTRNEVVTAEVSTLRCEKQILDLHWIHFKHRRTFYCENSAAFRKLFGSEEFNTDLAAEIVNTKGAILTKLQYMGIAHRWDIQLELCALRTRDVHLHHKNSRPKESIGALVYFHQRRPNESSIERHYAGYRALRLCQGNISAASKLLPQLGEDPLSVDQLKRMKSRLEKWFDQQPGRKSEHHWRIIDAESPADDDDEEEIDEDREIKDAEDLEKFKKSLDENHRTCQLWDSPEIWDGKERRTIVRVANVSKVWTGNERAFHKMDGIFDKVKYDTVEEFQKARDEDMCKIFETDEV